LRIIDLGGQHAPDYSKRRGQHLPDWQLLFHYFYVSGSGGQLSPEYPLYRFGGAFRDISNVGRVKLGWLWQMGYRKSGVSSEGLIYI
ncbi:MAG: hypothetical protein JJU34_16725, partial [Lunatimonas sp.]|uniref:hypothetical protein n=1 Tax=Lunatimonas sp. TaxID=2060141 RepID=UPI00263B48CB